MMHMIIIALLLMGFWPSVGHAAPALVKSCLNAGGGSATTITCTFGSNVSANNLVVCGIIGFSVSSTITVSDTAGSSYSQASVGYIDYATTPYRLSGNYAVAAGTFTVVTATYSAGTTNRGIACDEFSGTATASVVDGSNGQVDSANSTATDSVTVGSITTTVNGDLIWSAGWDGSNSCNGMVAGTGYTISNNTVCRVFTEYQIQSSSGAINASWTPACCTNTPYMVVAMAFKPLGVASNYRGLLLGVYP